MCLEISTAFGPILFAGMLVHLRAAVCLRGRLAQLRIDLLDILDNPVTEYASVTDPLEGNFELAVVEGLLGLLKRSPRPTTA